MINQRSALYIYQSHQNDKKNPLGTLRQFLKFEGERGPLSFSLIEMPVVLPSELTLRQSLLLDALEMDPFYSKEDQLNQLLAIPTHPIFKEIIAELKNLDLYPHQVDEEDLAWVSLIKGLLRPGQFLFYIESEEVPVANHHLWYKALLEDPRPLLVHSPYGDFWRGLATNELQRKGKGQFHNLLLRKGRQIPPSDNFSPMAYRKAV